MSKPYENCWLSRFASTPCSGRMDRVHLVPKQRMKRELRSKWKISKAKADEAVWHDAFWVWGCRSHHSQLDVSRTLRIPREQLPPKFIAYMQVAGLGHLVDYEYPPEDASAEPSPEGLPQR